MEEGGVALLAMVWASGPIASGDLGVDWKSTTLEASFSTLAKGERVGVGRI